MATITITYCLKRVEVGLQRVDDRGDARPAGQRCRLSVPGQIGSQDLVLAVESGAQRGEVGTGGADAVQEQRGSP